MPRTLRHPHRDRGGFTLVEMLIKVAIIIILLTILVSALAKAVRGGQKARTEFLMTSISKALVTFESEVGYLPPVLDMKGDLIYRPGGGAYRMPLPPTTVNTPLMAAPFEDLVQDWFSYTSLPEYLLGYGDRTQDGHGVYGPPGAAAAGSPGSREFPRGGIRYPGDDGLWGAVIDPRDGYPALGLKAGRNLFPPSASGSDNNEYTNRFLQGKVYGPYMEQKDERLIGGISMDVNGNPQLDANGEPVIVFAGEVPDFDDLPKVFVDYWGKPIRYYRTMYPHPLIKSAYRPLPANLGDVVLLRPQRFSTGQDTDTTSVFNDDGTNITLSFADAENDTSTSRMLQSAKFALFSSGPDRSLDSTRRVDTNDFNRDNIVEIGP
jgi:type II secretory pathway pseudopilin PulG